MTEGKDLSSEALSPPELILFLLKSGFQDPAYEGREFFCPHCLRIEGLLALFPVIRHNIDIRYVDFSKPRGSLPFYRGEENQSCPQLILPRGDDSISGNYSQTGLNGSRAIDSTSNIIDYLIERYALPVSHP